MSRIAKTILFDKDIRALQPKEKKYCVVVGNPMQPKKVYTSSKDILLVLPHLFPYFILSF